MTDAALQNRSKPGDASTVARSSRHGTETGFLFKAATVARNEYRYTVYVPRGYVPDEPHPLIVYLHGVGSCGTDGWAPVLRGLGPAIMAAPDEWPFIVVIPQKPEPDYAWEQYDELILTTMEHTRLDFHVDATRIYLTGLSQGGHGTWVVGAKHADLWAAIAPICGFGGSFWPVREPSADLLPAFTGPATEIGEALRDTPVWAFHGEADPVVPVTETRDLVAAVKAAGGYARLTTYPGVDHNSWDRAYQTENLGAWFLSHTRPAK